MKLLAHLRIRTRVAIAVILPLLGFAAVSAYVTLDKRRTALDMADLQTVAGLAAKASSLLHELQKERGASAVFIGSAGKQMRGELADQRRRTDAAQGVLAAALRQLDAGHFGSDFAAAVERSQASLAALDEQRRKVSDLAVPAPESFAYYTGTNADLLAMTESIAKVTGNADVSALVTVYVNYMRGKEKAGQARAVGSAGLAAGIFTPEQYLRFVRILAEQDTFFQAAAAAGGERLSSVERRTVDGPAVDEVMRIRRVILDGGLAGDLEGVEAPHWFDQATRRINLQKQVEDHIAADLDALTESIHGEAQAAFVAILATVVALFALTVLLGAAIVRGISRPVGDLTSAMTRLAEGDMSVEVAGADGKDEIAAMASALQVFKENAAERRRMEAEHEAEVERKAARAERVERVTAAFRNTVGEVLEALASAAAELDATAKQLTTVADGASGRAASVAAAAEQASSSVETVAASADQLTASIREVSSQVTKTSGIADTAQHKTSAAIASVEGLREGAEKIGAVIAIINGIAEQTNLLALNATIEAARAGEAGKGFAVVASEVKALATQAARATEEIGEQIRSMQGSVETAVPLIQGIAGVIGELNEIAAAVASTAEEQAAATDEIGRSANEAARGTQDVSRNVVGLQQASSETSTGALQVLSAAGSVAARAESLKSQVGNFLTEMSAA